MKGLLLIRSENYTAHLEPLHEVMGRERESKGLGFCFYWGQGWEPWVSQAHSSLANLKLMSGNLKCTSSSNGYLLKSTNVSETRESGGDRPLGPGSLSGSWQCVFLKTAIIEVGASLKWIPWQSKVNEVRHLNYEKKSQLSGLTLHISFKHSSSS